MDILKLLSAVAGIASKFVGNPDVKAGLSVISDVTAQTSALLPASGTTGEQFTSQLATLLPQDLLTKLLNGEVITVQIDGKLITQAITDLSKASSALDEFKSAFTVK